MLRTKITDLFGVSYPIMSAPMTNHSGGQLAAAVSQAGGLGSFGGIHPAGPDFVRAVKRSASCGNASESWVCISFRHEPRGRGDFHL